MEELANYQGQAVEVSSADLVGAYSGNAVRADSSYLDKALKVTAVVKEIGKSSKGSYFARLEGAGNDSVDVFFVPSAISALAAVNKGQTITIIGQCRGYNPPDMADTAEILRILGAGRSVNIVAATFPVGELQDYPGTVDAVIVLNTAVERPEETIPQQGAAPLYRPVVTVNMDYQVPRTRDSSLIGRGKKSATDKWLTVSPEKGDPIIYRVLEKNAVGKAADAFTNEIG
jgi:hypothetical protein